jgi:dephospho-CoA kinase
MVLGITGISGSGKHTAADFFKQKGWAVLDADKIAHYLYRPYTHVWKAVTQRFGNDILNKDDTIDRQKLGAIVFSAGHEKDLGDLNEITHPAIKQYIKDEIHSIRRKKPNIIVVAALWKEIGFPDFCEKILLLTVDKNIAFERIRKRDGINKEVYEGRISNQVMPEKPDFIVVNNGDFKEFYTALNRLALNNEMTK